MAANEAYTELLFSYGTLQLVTVQMATFGRQLAGTSDVMQGFELVSLKIDDETVVAISGKADHTIARFTGRASDLVSGKGLLSRQRKFKMPMTMKWQRSSESL